MVLAIFDVIVSVIQVPFFLLSSVLCLNVFKAVLMFITDVATGRSSVFGLGALLRPLFRDLNKVLVNSFGKAEEFDFKLVHVCLVAILMALVLVRTAVATPQTYLLEKKAKRE